MTTIHSTSSNNQSSPAQQIALLADQLRDISARGARFADNIYEKENYQAIQDIAMSMLALATGDTLDEMELLRAPVFSRATPVTVGDAAIIDDAGRILLIRRADNKLWAMPGGGLEVGETPAEGATREAFEETGVRCRATTLIGVFDSRHCGTVSRHQLYQFVFLCQPLEEVRTTPSHANEVLDIQWFAEADLPDAVDPGHISRIADAFRVWRGDIRAFFDG